MRQPLVAGNWKMNGSLESIRELMTGITGGAGSVSRGEIAVCPPFVYLQAVGAMVDGTTVQLGAQNVADQDEGAFTGEISPAMLREMGCVFAIVGHSERRNIYGEDDELVARRYAAARRHGLKPILCVGELLGEREQGITEQVVRRQLDAVIALEGAEALADGVIAYEPVWAIGTGKTATPEQAQEVHAFIRGHVAEHDQATADVVRILYGGSVKASNAAELFAQPDIDGGLIGGASLEADDFLAICGAA